MLIKVSIMLSDKSSANSDALRSSNVAVPEKTSSANFWDVRITLVPSEVKTVLSCCSLVCSTANKSSAVVSCSGEYEHEIIVNQMYRLVVRLNLIGIKVNRMEIATCCILMWLQISWHLGALKVAWCGTQYGLGLEAYRCWIGLKCIPCNGSAETEVEFGLHWMATFIWHLGSGTFDRLRVVGESC